MSRALLLSALSLMIASLAAAQSSTRAHMEACTEWKREGGHIGTRNDCNRPVAIKFMAYDGSHLLEADVPPGGWFDSGVVDGSIEGYLFTVCPVGYIPSVRFSLENAAPIADSLYNCLPLNKPDA
ncbi:MAG: hypothetical protein J0H44_26465 [Alphaproteobacteria bacterium]|nr:hypothetical protein [Alphaproteobacteria bacterium]